jgi:membrane protein DedA with SNARE-associated domain
MLAKLHEGWALVEPFIATYGVIAVFFMVLAESFGAPLPGETGVITASLLAANGDMSIIGLFVAVLAGAITGDFIGFWIGHFGGRKLLRTFGPYIRLTPEKVDELEIRFRKQGLWLVACARFIPLLRQLNGLLAGSFGMRWYDFLAAQSAGALAWTSLYVFGPYFFSELFQLAR